MKMRIANLGKSGFVQSPKNLPVDAVLHHEKTLVRVTSVTPITEKTVRITAVDLSNGQIVEFNKRTKLQIGIAYYALSNVEYESASEKMSLVKWQNETYNTQSTSEPASEQQEEAPEAVNSREEYNRLMESLKRHEAHFNELVQDQYNGAEIDEIEIEQAYNAIAQTVLRIKNVKLHKAV